MKIGLVWPANDKLTDITVRYERYVRGFEALGHQVVTVCPASTEAGYPHPTRTVRAPEDLRDPSLWRELGLDVAVVIAWLRMPELLRAIKTACPHVVSIGDSDGIVGVRVWPLTILRRMVALQPRWRKKAATAKYWVQLVAGGYRSAERPIIECADAADLITMTSPAARVNLAAVFDYHRRPDLVPKIEVVPYPVDEEYLHGAVPSVGERASRVVAIGRWDDPQKDAPLMAAGIEWAAQRAPDAEFVLVGRNGGAAFAGLCRRVPRVKYVGVQPPAAIAELLRRSRVLALASRWESGPIVAFEAALAAGATVAGPQWVPACEWFCADGSYGSLCGRRSGADLGGAIVQELNAWRDGQRDPQATAAHWRTHFDPVNVCRMLLPDEC